MGQFKTILLPTDLLGGRFEVADVAARIARRFDSSVVLLHVIEPEFESPIPLEQDFEQETGPLQQLIDRISEQGVVVAESAIEIGPVVESITRRAHEINADLIVLGAGESSPPDRQIVGPVAQSVLEQASQPVLVVRPGEPLPHFRKILCPVDHSETSRWALAQSIALAKKFSSELVVLSVVPEVNWVYASLETGNLAHAQVAHRRKWEEDYALFLKKIDLSGVKWSRQLRQGVPDDEIRAATAENGADVLVMGATGRSGLARMLVGSVTRRMILNLPCSLLSVKQDAGHAAEFEADWRALNVLMAQGQGLLQAQSYEAAIAKFRCVLSRHPFHAPAMQGLATALRHLDRPDEAKFYDWRARVLHGEKWD